MDELLQENQKAMLRMFRGKIREVSHDLFELKKRTAVMANRMAHCPDEDVWFWKLCLEQWKKGEEELQKNISKWEKLCDKVIGKERKYSGKSIDIKKLKEIPIPKIIEKEPVNKMENRWRYLCPLHNEKTPSFVYYSDQNSFCCYGCGVSGSVIDFVMAKEGVELKEALKFLSDKYKS